MPPSVMGLANPSCHVTNMIIRPRYGSSAATGKGHHTLQAILLGPEGSDPEAIDAGTILARCQAMLDTKSIMPGGHRTIHHDRNRQMIWRYDQMLPAHPNGMKFSAFNEGGNSIGITCSGIGHLRRRLTD
ncbi:allosteric substrate binding domain-containing protein [Thelephora terrestris]|uniref:Allosteric substrate binding domain-containing protein n=1 Tax=Thelephora terrestris TaxID=56493 RepID=A0A9P6L8C0_9AGAM|nr:allosteric substrate binding domain-containing protein [Thelephora terrestris]